jgi:large subunit ribosomal protein L33
MAKKNTVLIRLVSTANTGFFYVKKKNPKKLTKKLSFNKYDPVVRKHVEFKEVNLLKLLAFAALKPKARQAVLTASHAIACFHLLLFFRLNSS